MPNFLQQIALWALLAVMSSCSSQQSRSELARLVSPNQKLVGVLTETLTGDSAGSIYQDLFLADQGIAFKYENPVFAGAGCSGVSFSWLNDYTVEIRYPTTCVITHFSNRWNRPSDLQVGRPNPIEIILARV